MYRGLVVKETLCSGRMQEGLVKLCCRHERHDMRDAAREVGAFKTKVIKELCLPPKNCSLK